MRGESSNDDGIWGEEGEGGGEGGETLWYKHMVYTSSVHSGVWYGGMNQFMTFHPHTVLDVQY